MMRARMVAVARATAGRFAKTCCIRSKASRIRCVLLIVLCPLKTAVTDRVRVSLRRVPPQKFLDRRVDDLRVSHRTHVAQPLELQCLEVRQGLG